ncbi:MAG: carbonic anhydrase [Sphingomonadaceae bacterium]
MSGIEPLIDGYRRFRAQRWAADQERWTELAQGQSPDVMLISCSDSRVDPGQIFDARPGELFVVRNVAALVPPFERGGGGHGVAAALEFAVTQLEVGHIVVMGHGSCGGCKAALTGAFRAAEPGAGGLVADWVGILDGARSRVRVRHGERDDGEALTAMEHEAVRTSLDNLAGYPFVAEREREGKLRLHGAWFAIADGSLHLLDEEHGGFAPA